MSEPEGAPRVRVWDAPTRIFHWSIVLLIPFIAWYLGISLVAALVMDIAIVVFYLVYAFVFNIAYDKLFPLPVGQAAHAV